MRQHPLTPMTDANLVRVMQAQTRRKVGLVAHEVVARGAAAIRARFAELQAAGVGVAVVDAVSNADLMLIGHALAGMKLVTAGSGIAIGLAQNWQRADTDMEVDSLPTASGHRAVVSGSCSLATQAQVQHFIDHGGQALAIDPLALAAQENADQSLPTRVVSAALAWAESRLPDGPVLIYATAPPSAVLAVQAQLGAARAGVLVERALSQIAVGLVHLGVRQLVVAGGEISGAVVHALGIQRMTIGLQIDPGVPWTSAVSKVCAGEPLHLALKSGNFGSPDFFSKAFAMLGPSA